MIRPLLTLLGCPKVYDIHTLSDCISTEVENKLEQNYHILIITLLYLNDTNKKRVLPSEAILTKTNVW